MASEIILISGSIRSGKSDFAESIAREKAKDTGKKVAYVATARAGDQEMAERIDRHRQKRPADWLTIENLYCPAAALQEAYSNGRFIVLLDSMAMVVSNLLCRSDGARLGSEAGLHVEISPVFADLCGHAAKLAGMSLIIVTEEVGWSLAPENLLGRAYQNLLGRINQEVAAQAAEVWLVVMGIPQRLK